MRKEIVEAYPDGELSLHVVWLPMVPGDSAWTAARAARMFQGHGKPLSGPSVATATDRPKEIGRIGETELEGLRVHQYYDANLQLGQLFVRDVFINCLEEALAATPIDHPLHAEMVQWGRLPSEEQVFWDGCLFYEPGIVWTDRAPAPTKWTRQVGFWGNPNERGHTGTFFHNDCHQPPEDSDWFDEVKGGLHILGSK